MRRPGMHQPPTGRHRLGAAEGSVAGGDAAAQFGCLDVRDRLEALAARDLPAADAAGVRRHLLGCVACRRRYAGALAAAEAFRAATGPEVAPATGGAVPAVDAEFFADLQRDVLAAVGAVRAPEAGTRSTPRGLAAPERASWPGRVAAGSRRRRLAAAAALLVGLALGGGGAFDGRAVDRSSAGAESALLTAEPQSGVRGLRGGWQEGFGFDDPTLETAPVSLRGLTGAANLDVGGGLGASAAALELVEGGALDLDEPIGRDR